MTLDSIAPKSTDPDWELASEAVSVKIRWFGLAVGVLIVTFGSTTEQYLGLYAILALGLVFTAFDTLFSQAGRMFLRDQPLAISALEAVFITLLCHFESGPESPFRFYYVLSLICCAIRYSPKITFITCGLDCLGYGILALIDPVPRQLVGLLVFTIVMLVWVSWAAAAMARLLKAGGDRLRSLNRELETNQAELESRIAERTRELEASQAQVLHQEKMAGFGLLAAGIAHEVGNPLTSISSVVQILEARGTDDYTREKLGLVTGQLSRIQGTLRELVTFSRPASDQRGPVSVAEVIAEALNIAKYYRGGKSRQIVAEIPDAVPLVDGIRDQLVQVVFNLVLNAIDATGKGGLIAVTATREPDSVVIAVQDNGSGIDPATRDRLFQPYVTTKRHGTGLGLFVTRKMIDDHRGRIECESEPGRGTTFRVFLPAPARHGVA